MQLSKFSRQGCTAAIGGPDTGRPNVSSQHNQLRNGICTTPDECVLLKTRPERLRRFELQTVHKEAVLARPSIARVLPDTRRKSQAPLFQFLGQPELSLCVGGRIECLAVRFASRQKSTAIGPTELVGGKQFGTSLPYLQGKSRLCKNTVLRLLEGLDGGGINDRCRQ